MDDWLLGPEHCRLEDAKRQANLQMLKGYCMRALSSKEQERFKRHCLNGHSPGEPTVLHAWMQWPLQNHTAECQSRELAPLV